MRIMFGDGALSFREFTMREPLPLAIVHDAVLEFLQDRDDAALFGAQAVNAYVDESRMTQDVDLLSPRAVELAEEIRLYLNTRFKIAVLVREVRNGLGYRIYEPREPKPRSLVHVRPIRMFPPTQRVEDVLVVSPDELVAGKVLAFHRRRDTPRAGTDRRDVAMLLLKFPNLKTEAGPVRARLDAAGADAGVLAAWSAIVAEDIRAEEDGEKFE